MSAVRVLFAPLHELGHVMHMLPIAQRLRALGHEVAFVSPRDLTPTLAAAGLDVPCLGDRGAPVRAMQGRVPIENDAFMLRYYGMMITRVIEEGAVHALVEAGMSAIASFGPDVVCADPLAYDHIMAATRAGVPWAGVSPLLLAVAPRDFSCVLMRAVGSMRRELSARLVQMGHDGALSAGWHEVVSPWLNVVYASEAFVPRACSGNDYSWYVPPPLREDLKDAGSAEFPWAALDPTRPLVYVSGGGGESLAFPDELFLKIADAIGAGAQGVFALQRAFDGPVPAQLPPHVVAVRRAPQIALLARASLVVTHGGANSVAECLRAGVPMLVLPIGHEQPLQAALVERAGVGLSLPLRASAADLAAAVSRLLGEPRFRERARELAEGYVGDGAALVAERLVRLARERTPQPVVTAPAG